MANSYTRQSSFTDGDIIKAEHGNAEFDALVRAFQQDSGHSHDGTVGGGAPIPVIKDITQTHDLEVTATGLTGSVLKTSEAENSDKFIMSQKATKQYTDEQTGLVNIDLGNKVTALDSSLTGRINSVESTLTSDLNNHITSSTALFDAIKVAMTESEFNALRTNRNLSNAGSGVLTPLTFDSSFLAPATAAYKFTMKPATYLVDGILYDQPQTELTLPAAPDGLDKKTGGRFTNLGNAINDGGTDLTASVLSRQVLVVFETSIADITISDINDPNVYRTTTQLKKASGAYRVVGLLDDYSDSDLAMVAAGYTKSSDRSVGWTRTGFTAIPVALVQQRNQGAGHPMNPNGCRGWRQVTAPTNILSWFSSGAFEPSSLSQCFDFKGSGYAGASDYGGNISQGLSKTWNGDGKYYDAIYASDVQDLRIQAKKVDKQDALFTGSNDAVAARLRGHEAVPFTRIQNKVATSLNVAGTSFQTDDTDPFTVGDKIRIVGVSNDVLTPWVTITAIIPGVGVVWSGNPYNRVSGTTYYAVHESQRSKHTSESPTWTDIIGTPANIAATAATLGVDGFYGTWIPLIPDNTTKTAKGTRKSLSTLVGTMTTDNGVSWGTSGTDFTNSSNSDTHSFEVGSVRLLHYKTKAHFTEESDNLAIEYSNDYVIATNHNDYRLGCLVSNLTGKVATGAANPALFSTSLTSNTLNPITSEFFTNPLDSAYPENLPITLGTSSSPAVKTIISLVEVDGMMTIQFNFKEMKYDLNNSVSERVNVPAVPRTYIYGHPYTFYGFNNQQANERPIVFLAELTRAMPPDWMDGIYFDENGDGRSDTTNVLAAPRMKLWDGNGWGDDNKFQITDGVSTLLDENGNSVKYGTHICKLPYYAD